MSAKPEEAGSAAEDEAYPAAALARAGIKHPYQLLLWAPRKYRDFAEVDAPVNLFDHLDQKIVLRLRITRAPQPARVAGRFVVRGMDDFGREHTFSVFGQIRFSPWRNVRGDMQIHIETKIGVFDGLCRLNNVELIPSHQVGKVVPVYAGKTGVIGADAVARAAAYAVDVPRAIDEACIAIRQAFGGAEEDAILKGAGLGGSLQMLVYHLHRPASLEMAHWALEGAKALAVANIHHYAVQIGERRLRIQSAIRIDPGEVDLALRALPFSPTRGPRSQEAAIREVSKLLAEPRQMDAILTADVGVGKTLCYMIPAILAQRHGAKVAVLVPNTILADNIVQEFRQCVPNAPIAQVTDATRKEVIDWSANPILIGTTRMFAVVEKQRWKPDFLVIDEQQKMSSTQRDRLCTADTNVLEASATPMPRTLALLRYGSKTNIEVDVVHAVKTITTRVIAPDERSMVFTDMRRIVAQGDQVAVIYPRVQAATPNDPLSVIAAASMWEKHFPGNVVTIHGKLTEQEKIEAMRLAKSGERQVIAASSIVEIGVTIPRLRALMVVSAERYGTSTLHQMRGRLARHGGEGLFWLYLPKEVEPESFERVALLGRTTNGFALAKYDMELRGFGTLSDELGVVTESGASRTVFRGIDLMPEDLEVAKV